VKTKALLDTGADNNLVRRSVCSEAKLKMNKGKTIAIRGVGTENSLTEGRVMTDCNYYGIEARNIQFDVVDDGLIGYPIILSRKFCAQQNLVLNIKKRKISKVYDDDSKVSIYLNSEDESPKEIIQENIKVYATEKVKLKPGINEVSVQLSLYCQQGNPNLYFDGKCRNHKIQGVGGIASSKLDEKRFSLGRRMMKPELHI